MEFTTENLVRIEQKVPLTIFNEPILESRLDELFNDAKQEINNRINEIFRFINSNFSSDFASKFNNSFSTQNVAFLFKCYFCKSVLNDAIKLTFNGDRNYDVLSNILSFLTNQNLQNAIMGETMIDTFSKTIRTTSANATIFSPSAGLAILLLKQNFLKAT